MIVADWIDQFNCIKWKHSLFTLKVIKLKLKFARNSTKKNATKNEFVHLSFNSRLEIRVPNFY